MDFVEQEFGYARDNGWLPYFAQASKDYAIPPALLMAIASRETNMRNIIGDGGHGYSLMQIDIRSFPDWCASGAWRNVAQAIEKGAQVFDGKRSQIEHGIGHQLVIDGLSFVGGPATGDDLLRCATAMYNAGLWPYYCLSKGKPIDAYTTGRNYSTDVWARKAEFERLMAQ